MKRFAFIHGSSVGQSTFVPTDAVEDICKYLRIGILKGVFPDKKALRQMKPCLSIYAKTKVANLLSCIRM